MITADSKPSAQASTPKLDARQALQNPIRRRGDAQNIANAALFLVSNLARLVTRESLAVNSGMPTDPWHPSPVP